MRSKAPAGAQEPLIGHLEHDVARLKVICGKRNADIILRRFRLWSDPEVDLAVFYVEGLVDRTTINLALLEPLMILSRLARPEVVGRDPEELLSFLTAQLVPAAPATSVGTIEELIDHVFTGEAGILIDGVPKAIVVEAKGWEHRTITEPSTEAVIRGPREGFNEVLRMNTALIRRRIRSPRLRLDPTKIGRLSQTDLVVGWLDGITNPDLVAEIKRRLNSIETDWIPDSGYIEQYLEDFPYSPFPQFQYTERPDRTVAGILEGRVAILVDGSPLALLIPGGLSNFIITTEDYYERFPYGSLLRLLRLAAAFIALTLPALYIAVTTFHQELLPTTLVLAFAASREPVPFPALLEAFLMIGGLELTREAGLRLPAPIGQTVGIVAALLLGQASVQAGLASPIMVIVLAITALSSFVVPHYASGLPLRWLVFPLMVLGGTLGLFGVTAGMVAIVLHLAGLTSVGIPYLAPLSNVRQAVQDFFLRMPLWTMRRRPAYLNPEDEVRQGRTRAWSTEEGGE